MMNAWMYVERFFGGRTGLFKGIFYDLINSFHLISIHGMLHKYAAPSKSRSVNLYRSSRASVFSVCAG